MANICTNQVEIFGGELYYHFVFNFFVKAHCKNLLKRMFCNLHLFFSFINVSIFNFSVPIYILQLLALPASPYFSFSLRFQYKANPGPVFSELCSTELPWQHNKKDFLTFEHSMNIVGAYCLKTWN